MTWKTSPLGFKLIPIWLSLGVLSGLLSIIFNPSKPILFLWIPILAPWSILITTFLLSIDFYLIIQIIRATALKAVFALLVLKLLNFLVGIIAILATPLPKLATLFGFQEPATLADSAIQVKIYATVPGLVALSIGMYALIYLVRHRNFFDTKSNQDSPTKGLV